MENIEKHMNMLKKRYQKTMHPSYLYRMGLVCEKHKLEDPRKYYLAASYMNYKPAIHKLNEMNIDEIKQILNRIHSNKKYLIDYSNNEFNLIFDMEETNETK